MPIESESLVLFPLIGQGLLRAQFTVHGSIPTLTCLTYHSPRFFLTFDDLYFCVYPPYFICNFVTLTSDYFY